MSTLFQRVLVPVDGSRYMSGVVAHAIAIAKKTGCSLTFLYVVNVEPVTTLEERTEGSTRIPDECRRKPAVEDVSASSRIEMGSPAETIVERGARPQSLENAIRGKCRRRGHGTGLLPVLLVK